MAFRLFFHLLGCQLRLTSIFYLFRHRFNITGFGQCLLGQQRTHQFINQHGKQGNIPDQISITGYDDSMYASMVRPKLTTVHQDVQKKAHMALKRLMKLIQGEELKELNIKSPVYLVKRDSVRE